MTTKENVKTTVLLFKLKQMVLGKCSLNLKIKGENCVMEVEASNKQNYRS
jgi:hypothetical protein